MQQDLIINNLFNKARYDGGDILGRFPTFGIKFNFLKLN